MPDIRAIAMSGKDLFFKRKEEEEEILSPTTSDGDISLDDTPQGKIVWVSVGRGWRQGRVLSSDGDTYRVRTKRGVVTVSSDRVLTQEERNSLRRFPQNTVIRR